jgi:hypothetical protein
VKYKVSKAAPENHLLMARDLSENQVTYSEDDHTCGYEETNDNAFTRIIN